MCRTKRFIIVAVLSALVLTLSSIGLACGAKPAQTPTPSESEIPANYTTYTDESKLFSISYPSDWEMTLSVIPGLEQNAKEAINNLKSGIPLQGGIMIFFAGRSTEAGYDPNISIAVDPTAEGISTLDEMVEVEVLGVKKVIPDYRELSRVQTTVDGREATILDWEGTPPEQAKRHYLAMLTLVDKTIWVVNGSALTGDFAKWQKDFNVVVRSLQVSTETK